MSYELVVDVNPFDPREFKDDCLTTIVAGHKRYNLGDINVTSAEQFDEEEKKASYTKKYNGLFRKIWLYDHGALHVELDSANPYWQHAYWDSGIIGFIYVDFNKAKKIMGWKKITASRAIKLKEYLEEEFRIWKAYIEGDTYAVKDTDSHVFEFEGTYEECEKWLEEENNRKEENLVDNK